MPEAIKARATRPTFSLIAEREPRRPVNQRLVFSEQAGGAGERLGNGPGWGSNGLHSVPALIGHECIYYENGRARGDR